MKTSIILGENHASMHPAMTTEQDITDAKLIEKTKELENEITERRQTENELHLTHRINTHFNSSAPLDNMLQTAADSIRTHFNCNACNIFLIDKNKCSITRTTLSTDPDIKKQVEKHTDIKINDISIPQDNSCIFTTIVKNKKLIFSENMRKISETFTGNKTIKDFIDKVAGITGLKTTIQTPLIVEDEVIGILGIADSNHISQKNITTFSRLASQLAIAIRKAHLEAELHESEKNHSKSLLEIENQLRKEKKNIEKKVTCRTEKLKKEKDHVEHLLNQKTELINQLSHDLRTPLTPIIGLLPVIINSSKDKNTINDLNMILRNARYLNTLLTRTLDTGRIESSTKFNKEKIELSAIIKDIIEINKPIYCAQNITAVNSIKGPVLAIGDAVRVREILENLQANAAKFMPDGGTLTYTARENMGEIMISISDTGTGIEKEDIKKIFEMYFKADTSRHNPQGTGLGLSICEKLVKNMKGRIWAESAGKNKGTTIYFTLPACDPGINT